VPIESLRKAFYTSYSNEEVNQRLEPYEKKMDTLKEEERK
jgi:hypothetical protein